jgi:hypothetical protein
MLIGRLYEQNGEITSGDYTPATKMHPNEYLILRNGKKSILATCLPSDTIKGQAIYATAIRQSEHHQEPVLRNK